jgi:hypothetical protein
MDYNNLVLLIGEETKIHTGEGLAVVTARWWDYWRFKRQYPDG